MIFGFAGIKIHTNWITWCFYIIITWFNMKTIASGYDTHQCNAVIKKVEN